MAIEAERRQWRDAVEDVINAPKAAGRYQPREARTGRGTVRADDGPRPLEFDEGGFPIPQSAPRFRQRIGRLIYG